MTDEELKAIEARESAAGPGSCCVENAWDDVRALVAEVKRLRDLLTEAAVIIHAECGGEPTLSCAALAEFLTEEALSDKPHDSAGEKS